jgi:effector-binding domain-containing protein
MTDAAFQCEEKSLPAIIVAAVRMKAPYRDCGQGFRKLGKAFWSRMCGPAMMLCYDAEYKEIADYEVCFPIKKGEPRDGIEVRELPAGRCVSLLHRGPYEELSRSHAIARDYAAHRGYKLLVPCREVYLKGPGMIFKGNPKKYLTEIQLMIEPEAKENGGGQTAGLPVKPTR